MKHLVWISFDLGVKGDYEGMYAWLDRHGAKECGDSVACLWFEHRTDEFLNELKRELRNNVELDQKRNRVYVIRLVKGKMKGSFIFGQRKTPPWTGFGGTGENDEDSSDA